MILGRALGWFLIAAAVLMASGDAVLALGLHDHAGIVTGDLWMLLAGRSPASIMMPASMGAMLMAWPAWVLIGPVGLVLVAICRPRRRRYSFRRAN